MTQRTRQITDFLFIALAVALIDLVAKEIAASLLAEGPASVGIVGRTLQFMLVQNELSAFGVSLGPLTREINMAATSAALLLAVPACHQLRRFDPWAPVALGLIAGAALGNLLSMATSGAGVVDFIVLPVGVERDLVFNLADVAAYAGLVLLMRSAVRLWHLVRQERKSARNPAT